jgi:hypothetical protein
VAFNNTGSVQANAATLQFQGGGNGNGSFSIGLGTTLNFQGGTYGLGGGISGPGTLTASGAVLNFNSGSSESSLPALTVNGTTIAVASGVTLSVPGLNLKSGSTLEGNGTVNAPVALTASAIHAGMSPGQLTVSALTMDSNSRLNAEVGGPSACSPTMPPPMCYSQLGVTSMATLAGTLSVSYFGGYAGAAGDTYRLIEPGMLTGTFTNLMLPPPPTGTMLTVSYAVAPTGVVLQTSLGTVTGVSFNPTAVTGGTSSTGTVTISAVAPTGGIMVSLSSGNSLVGVPSSVTVPSGQMTQTFTATTAGVATTTPVAVTAILAGSTAMGTLTVNPAVITSVTFSAPTVTGGTGSTGTVALNGPAPAAGLTVNLMSSSSAASVSSSFTISANATSGTFSVNTVPVAAITTVSISAILPSGDSLSGTLTVIPPVVTQVSFNPSSVVSGQMTTGTVTLNGPAPAGFSVGLMTSNATAFPVPSGVTVPANSNGQTFMITAGAVTANTTVTVTATTGTIMVTFSVTVVAPPMVTSVAFSPSAVTGGTSSMGTVTISQAAPASGTTITLSSGDPSVTVPGSVTVSQGNMSQTFTAMTVGVATTRQVTMTATLGASKAMGTLTVNPAVISSVAFNPAPVAGGSRTTGTVTLSGPAPPAGFSVTLSSSDPTTAMVAGSFSFPGGATVGTFSVNTAAVTTNTNVTITVTLPSGNAVATVLTVAVNTGPGFTLSVPPSSSGGNGSTITVLPGDTATYTLMLVCTPGVTGMITLAGMAPQALQTNTLLTITPSKITCPQSTPVTVTITLQTNCPTSLVGPPSGDGWPTGAPWGSSLRMLSALLMGLLLSALSWGLWGRKQTAEGMRALPYGALGGRMARLAPAMVLLLAVTLPLCLAGCGVNNLPTAVPNGPITPAGTYPITIMGTGPSGAQLSITLTIRVI